MSYLITCSGSKVTPTAVNPSALENLSFHNELGEARANLINLTNKQLDWNRTLPAWQLYSGTYSRLYPPVQHANWLKNGVRIKILSALFGWIEHTDLLPTYNLKMDDRALVAGNNMLIHKYWFNTNLLGQYVDENDIDLLSVNYRKAITNNANPLALLPENVVFTDRGVQKGIWLNNRLNLL